MYMASPDREGNPSLDEMEAYFEQKKGLDIQVKLSRMSTVVNLRTFVESSLSELKANRGNLTFLASYDRLARVYELMKRIDEANDNLRDGEPSDSDSADEN